MTTINEHSGKKYLRRIFSAENNDSINVDVYQVTEAFKVTCGATHHAIKKLLCAGLRGKNDTLKDLEEARDAISRAIDLHKQYLMVLLNNPKIEPPDSSTSYIKCKSCNYHFMPCYLNSGECQSCLQAKWEKTNAE